MSLAQSIPTPSPSSVFDPIEDVIAAIARGEMVVIADDENRENEGDLVCAADAVTPTIINFMASEGRGLICVTLPGPDLGRLGIGDMRHAGDETDALSQDRPYRFLADGRGGPTDSVVRRGGYRYLSKGANARGDLRVPGRRRGVEGRAQRRRSGHDGLRPYRGPGAGRHRRARERRL